MGSDNISEMVFELERFNARTAFSREALQQTSVIDAEFIRDQLVATIRATVCTHNLAANEVRYPANWWQHFKKRWFPRWALARWPVLYETERIEIKALYPDMRIPNRGDHVLYARTERTTTN